MSRTRDESLRRPAARGRIGGAIGVAATIGISACDDPSETEPDLGCTQGTFSISARISGTGDYADGTNVVATFGSGPESVQNQRASIASGAFEIMFDSPSTTCNLGASRQEPVVAYIDVDADGACRLDADPVFAWWASSGHGEDGYSELSMSLAEHCRVGFVQSLEAERILDAARRLCPEIDDCLPFCGAPDVSMPPYSYGVYGVYCPPRADAGP